MTVGRGTSVGSSLPEALLADGDSLASDPEARESFLQGLLDAFTQNNPVGDNGLGEFVSNLLTTINKAGGFSYSLMYVSPRPFVGTASPPHLLEPFARAGISDKDWLALVHFNWRKTDIRDPDNWGDPRVDMIGASAIISAESRKQLRRGTVGLSDQLLALGLFAIPAYLSKLYRAVILFGGPSQTEMTERQRRFWVIAAHRISVSTLARRAGYDLTSLQTEWPRLVALLTHEYRGTIAALSDSVAIIADHLRNGSRSVYDRQNALEAADHLQALAVKVSIRTLIRGQSSGEASRLDLGPVLG